MSSGGGQDPRRWEDPQPGPSRYEKEDDHRRTYSPSWICTQRMQAAGEMRICQMTSPVTDRIRLPGCLLWRGRVPDRIGR